MHESTQKVGEVLVPLVMGENGSATLYKTAVAETKTALVNNNDPDSRRSRSLPNMAKTLSERLA